MFDEMMYKQVIGVATGIKCAPSFACLTIGYLEETILFITELQKYYSTEDCLFIKYNLKRFMDDGFIIWPKRLNIENFKSALNNLHPSIK